MSSRNYMFTVFFADHDVGTALEQAVSWANNLDEVFSNEIFRYVIVNIEVAPTTSAIHWQGYMELNRPSRFSYIKNLHPLLHDAHFEARMGTQSEAISYCSKSDTRHPDVSSPYQHGQPAPGMGHRSDLDSLSELVTSGKSIKEIASTMPGMFIRYHHGIEALRAALAEDDPTPEDDFQPRPWQQTLIDTLQTQPDDRHIIWVTDLIGNQGKSRLTKHLVRNHGATFLSGKLADMIYTYMNQRGGIVIFDLTRQQMEFSSHIYTLAEGLKNGFLMNHKYKSKTFFFKPPHVVIFSNTTWDRSKFSTDRVLETTLQPTPVQHVEQHFM